VWCVVSFCVVVVYTFYFVDVSVRYDEASKVEPALDTTTIIRDINTGVKAKEAEKKKDNDNDNNDNEKNNNADDDNDDDDNDKVVVGAPEERKRLETLRAKRCAKCGFRPTHKLKRL
jgi:hypothetical protein